MRFLTFAIGFICVISFTVFAASNSEDIKDAKFDANESHIKIAAVSTEANTNPLRHATAGTRKNSSADSVKNQTNNVQGLATTDRRYRYYD